MGIVKGLRYKASKQPPRFVCATVVGVLPKRLGRDLQENTTAD